MSNYSFFVDRHNQERIMRIRYPAFTATIKDAYDVDQGEASMSFDGKKIVVNELMHECPESKLNWALKKAIEFYKFSKKKADEKSK